MYYVYMKTVVVGDGINCTVTIIIDYYWVVYCKEIILMYSQHEPNWNTIWRVQVQRVRSGSIAHAYVNAKQ